jgi:hypothetical protein
MKIIKNEQWSVKELISKIHNKDISKPQFQRKRKWDIHPKNDNDNIPNEKAYIQFLYNNENSVHAITFGQVVTTERKICFSNIDGNNRINAIKHFIDKPFELFKEYLKNLFDLINSLPLNIEDKKTLEKIFCELSYNEIINFKYNIYFNNKGYDNLYLRIKGYRDEFEKIIEELQIILKIKGLDNFDSIVKINVNLFEGYTTHELCKIFENINKYNSKLTETELLASRLFNEYNFDITDNIFKTELEKYIKEYYEIKADGEALSCFNYEAAEHHINAHEFIVGFQNLCNNKYPKVIDINDETDGLSLFYKLWRIIYGSYDITFTTENVNDFIDKIMYSCNIFNETIESIFIDKINDKLFNKSCKNIIKTLKKNNLFVIISSIIGFKNKNTAISIIKNNLEKSLLYHFMVRDLKSTDNKDEFKILDSLTYIAGGSYIDNKAKQLLTNPDNISNKLTEKSFINLLDKLFSEVNNPHERKLENGNNMYDKRRSLKFFERILMFYYYKERMPCNLLNNDFSIEHICPNSSEWEGILDKDRTGNLIPIISKINSSRGNKHINEYSKTVEGKQFCEFIKDIIPKYNIYEKIISHKKKKPFIMNNNLYNNMCDINEGTYKQNFIDCIFK